MLSCVLLSCSWVRIQTEQVRFISVKGERPLPSCDHKKNRHVTEEGSAQQGGQASRGVSQWGGGGGSPA